MKISDKGLAFIASHEGLVLNAYLDPAGIVTIGYGFTNRSRVFSAWARAKWGRAMRMGDRLTKAEADQILAKLLEEEYEPPVERACPGIRQTAFDAAVSACYNLGPRSLKWRWGQALARKDYQAAGDLLRETGTTAGGRKLPGLVRRRAEEADLIATGRYPAHLSKAKRLDVEDALEDLQADLATLGYDPGPLDGVMGLKTRAAVRSFQADHPPLAVDGIPGPATRAAIDRALAGKRVDRPSLIETLLIALLKIFGGKS